MTGERRTLTAGRPRMTGARPRMTGARPGMMGARPGMMGARPAMTGERRTLTAGRPQMTGARPGMRGARPAMTAACECLAFRSQVSVDRLVSLWGHSVAGDGVVDVGRSNVPQLVLGSGQEAAKHGEAFQVAPGKDAEVRPAGQDDRRRGCPGRGRDRGSPPSVRRIVCLACRRRLFRRLPERSAGARPSIRCEDTRPEWRGRWPRRTACCRRRRCSPPRRGRPNRRSGRRCVERCVRSASRMWNCR